MTNEERLKVAEATFARCLDIMRTKGAEYSRGEEDCLSNFKRVAEGLGLSALQVAWTYALKHVDSVTSYVKTGVVSSDEPIEGRLNDLINYSLIMMCLIQESRGAATTPSVEAPHLAAEKLGAYVYRSPQDAVLHSNSWGPAPSVR